jgi:hypothetical protein
VIDVRRRQCGKRTDLVRSLLTLRRRFPVGDGFKEDQVKTSIRWWSRLALMASVGLSAVAACSSDRPDGHGEEQGLGSLSLALQATAPSGSVYMLRNAFFQITNVRTGETVEFLTTEHGMPEATELTTLLNTGDYTVTLLPGWFLERVRRDSGVARPASAAASAPEPAPAASPARRRSAARATSQAFRSAGTRAFPRGARRAPAVAAAVTAAVRSSTLSC